MLARAKELFGEDLSIEQLETQYENYVNNLYKASPAPDQNGIGSPLVAEELYEEYKKVAGSVVDLIIGQHMGKKLNIAGVKSAVERVNSPRDDIFNRSMDKLQKGSFNIKHIHRIMAYGQQMYRNGVDDFLLKFLGNQEVSRSDKDVVLFEQRFLQIMMSLGMPSFKCLPLFQMDQNGKNGSALSLSIDQLAWLRFNFQKTLSAVPEAFMKQGGAYQIVRTTFGVAINSLWGIPEDATAEAIVDRYFNAAQRGLLLGITYTLVDGLLDIKKESGPLFSETNRNEVIDHIRNLLSGKSIVSSNVPFQKITLVKIAEHLFTHIEALPQEERRSVQSTLLVLLEGEIRDDSLKQATDLKLRDILISKAIKGGSTYLSAYLLGGQSYPESLKAFIEMGLLGQFNDDFSDYIEDLEEGASTVFTLGSSMDINPIEVYLSMISYFVDRFQDNPDKMTAIGQAVYRSVGNGSALDKIYSNYQHNKAWNKIYYEFFCQMSKKSKSSGTTCSHYTVFENIQGEYERWHPKNRDLQVFHMDVIDTINNEVLLSNPKENPHIDTANYSLKAGGKRLRPMLVLIMASIYNIKPARLMPLVATIERLHTASLIFDDLPAQDDANTRRGNPTAHKKYPEWQAQLAGIELILSSVEATCNGLSSQGFEPDVINRVTVYITEKSRLLNKGQVLDLKLSRNPAPILDDDGYLRQLDCIAALKTGSAIDLSIVPVALLAGADEQTIQSLQDFSERLGIMYQIVDDILDHSSTTDQLGKDAQGDAKNGLKTSVDILGLECSKARLNTMVSQLQRDHSLLLKQSKTLRDVVGFIVSRHY